MNQLRRLTALLLCIFMMIPSQGMTVLAEAVEVVEGTEKIERISETLPLEAIEGAESTTSRIKETLALEPMKKDLSDEGIIYWNPGGELPEELATASNAQAEDSEPQSATASNSWMATPPNAQKGNDNADGRTPSTPVKTLAKALTRAEELMKEEGLLPADITIYAMNPMEITDGNLYALNGGTFSIKSWPGRSYDSDIIFYINGGQLSMMNARLASGNPERTDDEVQLIYVRGGVFQMGQNVTLEGRTVLDYRSRAEEIVWETATTSDAKAGATASDAMAATNVADSAITDAEGGEVSFDLNEYVLDSAEDSMELIEDSVSASTWCDPIIELLEGFDGIAGEYLLELLADGAAKEIELVKTLYSGAETEEEFLGFFTLVEKVDVSWSLLVETQAVAQVRDTSLSNTFGVTEVLTSKTLVAARAIGDAVVYWNPGGAFMIGDTNYPAGNDSVYDGSRPTAPVKTWAKAVERAARGTVICIQTLDLGAGDADSYLTKQSDGSFLLDSGSLSTTAALSAWSVNPQPAIIVPEGEVLVMRNVVLQGIVVDGEEKSTQTILCDKGDLVIEENVSAELGYIQVNAFSGLKDHPVKVTSATPDIDGNITLFFGGINTNLSYCYVDVVTPAGDLADVAAVDADAVGVALLKRVQLHSANRDSKFNWSLRQDTAEDDPVVNAQNLELYAEYYFDAIYLDGERGNDSNFGATCDYPVKTWGAAQAIWEVQMQRSIDARGAAADALKTPAEIEELYPLPKVIYICGTVTVDSPDEPQWELTLEGPGGSTVVTDYDNRTVVTEVIPHMSDISSVEGSSTPLHEIPQTMVKVTGNLNIRDVTFRNMTDDAESVTIQVEGSGRLTLKGETLLTGQRLAKGSVTAKAVTMGTHVKVIGGGTFIMGDTFVMADSWTGAIEKRQHGVSASDPGSTVIMNSGYIQQNSSFEQSRYDAGDTGHKPGAGVLLSKGAKFTMNGGYIKDNTVYQYGAGVYMVDQGTEFVMKEGVISDNKMHISSASGTNSSVIRGYGIGIYAGPETVLEIGDDALITKNTGYMADGVGIWSDGQLTVKKATISENYIGWVNSTNVSLGVGIYVGENGTFAMDGGVVTGNYTSTNSRSGGAYGAGIYFASSTNNHSIKGSTISYNKVNNDYTTNGSNYSRGGGIYIVGGNLEISDDSVILGNEACLGGGICSYLINDVNPVTIVIENTIITENTARGFNSSDYGNGGGIYHYYYGTIILRDGVEITKNIAASSQLNGGGGGIYLYGSSVSTPRLIMESDTPGGIKINENTSLSGYGGGIFQYYSSIGARNVEINGNEAINGGGIYTYSNYAYGYFKDVQISENKAVNGGGLHLASGNTGYYVQDSSIEGNHASGSGGGIYLASTSAELHLTETNPGDFKLIGNYAEVFGGGVCLVNSSNFTMNIAGQIQNSATMQGSNFYVGGYGTVYILDGDFKQPENNERVDGVYNIYIDDTNQSTTAYQKYIDMSSVTVEAKSGSDPDVIYLNTTNSYLTFLAVPPDDDESTFPIDLNTEVFQPGSIVVKPAALTSVSVLKPDAALMGTVGESKLYSPSLTNAATNRNCYSGGKIPRRTLLGGFTDPANSTRTNVVVLGEGVYLSGAGDDSRDGSSPDTAVKTFGKASEILKERINEKWLQEKDLPDGAEKTGFSPFIYICGQVDIRNNETWELDYDDDSLGDGETGKNKYYAEAERAADEPVYKAQVRRFASFVNQPMIQVGTSTATGTPIAFTTEKIIINGMADAVITSDQSTRSPVIRGYADATVTLNKESQVTNNYNSGVDIYGTLILQGDADETGEFNKQLYNHHGAFVQLYGSGNIKMRGYARILADAPEKIGGIASYGIFRRSAGVSGVVSVEMEDQSVIEQAEGSSLLANAGIYSTYINTSILMKDEARVLNAGNAMTNGIGLTGQGSVLEMKDDASITASNNYIQYGVRMAGTDISVTMEGKANITQTGAHASAAEISGIYMSGTRPEVTMKGNAAIIFDAPNTSENTSGIRMAGTNPQLRMQGDARISGGEEYKLPHGVYLAAPTDAEIAMNMNDDGSEDDSARITNTTRGILFYGAITTPIDVQMGRYAAIEQNQHGIVEHEGTNSSFGITQFNLKMTGDSRISGNLGNGIRLNGYRTFTAGSDYQRITLEDRAVIGGENPYSSTDGTSGNQYAGIYANSPIELDMSGESKISQNGSTDNNNSTNANGIYLTRLTSSNHSRPGTAKITLSETASICDNRGGGVYVATITATTVSNVCEITLNGIEEDGITLSAPSIRGNTDAVFLGIDGTLKLQGGAVLGDTTYSEGSSYVARSLDCYGYLELDGRSTVDGLLYMRDGERPITMTHGVNAGDPTRKYKLHLVEGFIGRIVVKPDGNTTGMTDVTNQISYFFKASADGLAETRLLVPEAPNIVLQGENKVYLSGNGADTNSGNSPSTAVRTFKRAKELLEGGENGGYFTSGANIVICTSAVTVQLGDEDWSFNPGGYVTNARSSQTWKPLVIRDEAFKGVLISLPNNTSSAPSATYASTVIFKDITIDGGSEQGVILDTSTGDQLLYIGYQGTVILGEGAILQNNQAVSANYTSSIAMGVRVYGGTLQIDGGTIRNMVRQISATSASTSYKAASAISCQSNGSGTYPAKIIMNSGQIVDNELNCINAHGIGAYAGTIYLMDAYASMEMNGGLISNNKAVTRDSNPGGASALVIYQGSAVINGGMIRGNEGGLGSAIFYNPVTTAASSLVLSGGQISGNTTNAASAPNGSAVGTYSPIYIYNNYAVAYGDFQLKGGGADIQDSIYLYSSYLPIKVSGHIYQTNRLYRVYLNTGTGANQFKKASVVVQPDRNQITDTAQYLKHFQVRSNPYVLDRGRLDTDAGTVAGVKESQCLILMKAVYLDSEQGVDSSATNAGTTPALAVKTFTKAKAVGGTTTDGSADHYIIYISGKAINLNETEWFLPDAAYLCRYTGFAVYKSDGSESTDVNRAYYGPLIEPTGTLTLKNITVTGRRVVDSTTNNGDSLVNILSGVKVSVETGATFTNNYNIGAYVAADGRPDSLPSKGGAFHVSADGDLTMKGGTIRDTEASYGSAVYLEASETDPDVFGHLYLTGDPVISGKVYLDGTGTVTAAYVQPDGTYQPSSALGISLRNDYNGRPVIQYVDSTIPGYNEIEYYTFDPAIQALYDITNRASDGRILELNMRRAIYLDGQRESGGVIDGRTPETAFRTLKEVYQDIGLDAGTNGVLVYVVDTVEVSSTGNEPAVIELMNIEIRESDGSRHYEGYYKENGNDGSEIKIQGQVYFKRYAQPSGYRGNKDDPDYAGYHKETLTETLFHIKEDGQLTMSGIYVDGHALGSDSIDKTLVADGVEAASPLITVEGSGILYSKRAEGVSNAEPTATLLLNNFNNRKQSKDRVIGVLNESSIVEGSGSGIELLEGGTCYLEYTEFKNLSLGDRDNVLFGGTDVYSNGFLHFSKRTLFSGTVFLEGFATVDDTAEVKDNSRYLIVDLYGTPAAMDFQVLMRDPYTGRDVVHYDEAVTLISAEDIATFRMEERVKDFFCLRSRSGEPHILELQVPTAVYIDGIDGEDDPMNRAAGSTPDTPVKTLKRAFELLSTRGGNTIYVVNTVQLDSATGVTVTGMSYQGSDGTVVLGSTTKVRLIRYIQPDFAEENPSEAVAEGYDVEDFTGVLLNVMDGTAASFSNNVYFDGHSKPKIGDGYGLYATVSRSGEAKAPMITVASGGTLNLSEGTTLQDNNNIYEASDGQDGGAIANSGTVNVNGALFENNQAKKGSVVYQDGTFNLQSKPENLSDHANAFYLTTSNGTNHVIRTAVAIPDEMVFDVDMDNAVKGRPVVRFTDSSAYSPHTGADAEYEHFELGGMVSPELFLVESELDPELLELQNWEMLEVEVPASIYLVISRKGTYDASTKLRGVMADALSGNLFSTPEYKIENRGNYAAKVSISGFVNQTQDVGINTVLYPLMNLTDGEADALGSNDLYLAIKGLDGSAVTETGSGFGMGETSLKPYAEDSVTEEPSVLGTLSSGTTGNFTFIGAVGTGFMEQYLDLGFPLEGVTGAEAQAYIDGTSDIGIINARAKYLLRYKVEIDPPRRGAALGSTP